MKRGELGIWVVGFAIAASIAAGCTDTHPTPGDKNTNWLRPCKASSECGGGLDCIADVCTRACDSIEDCKVPELALQCAAGVCAMSTAMPKAGSSAPAPDASMPMAGSSAPAPDASMPTPDGGEPMPMACEPEGSSRKPGPNRYDTMVPGPGACSGTNLAGVIAAIHAAYPDLADISYVFDPDSPPPPIVLPHTVTAFELVDGFAIVMRRGAGDCESGCIENEYWYFRTDANCAPQQVNHYRPHTYAATCLLEGYPMWDEPVPPAALPPACGVGEPMQPLMSTHLVAGCGKSLACAGSGKVAEDVSLEIRVEVDRNMSDPSMGTVILSGTGHALLDGRPLAATFEGEVVRASVNETLPSTCLDQFNVELLLDFDGNREGYLRFEEARTPNCTTGGELCKGNLTLDFGRGPRDCGFANEDILTAIDWARATLRACEADDDCSLVPINTECLGSCQVGVRSDAAAELERIVEQVGAAYCPDTTCQHTFDCEELRAACRDGNCTAEAVSP